MMESGFRPAYDPEKQSGAVKHAQESSVFFNSTFVYDGNYEVVDAAGQEWIIIGARTFLRDRHFDEAKLASLEEGAVLVAVTGNNTFTNEEGAVVSPIGCLYGPEGAVIYKNPLLDEDLYKTYRNESIEKQRRDLEEQQARSIKRAEFRRNWKQTAQAQRAEINRRRKGR